MSVYSAVVLSTLLYGTEPWPTYARRERKLISFHMRYRGKILRIHWSDKVTNVEVLARAKMPTLYEILRKGGLWSCGGLVMFAV